MSRGPFFPVQETAVKFGPHIWYFSLKLFHFRRFSTRWTAEKIFAENLLPHGRI